MVSGFGEHGHHAQLHVEQGLKSDRQTLAMGHSMQACHVVEVGLTLQAVKVNQLLTV